MLSLSVYDVTVTLLIYRQLILYAILLDSCTYIMARRDLAVTTSRGRDLNKIIHSNIMEIPDYIPGGSYHQITNLAIKTMKASSHCDNYNVYLVGGLPDLTTHITNKKQLYSKPKWMRKKILL